MKNIILNIENLNIKYGKKYIIKDLNYEFIGPSLYIIKGKNGSGKSTLFKALLNQKKIASGNIISSSYIKGIIEDPSGYFDLSSLNQLKYLLNNNELKEINNLIEKFEMKDNMNKIFYKLSLGMKEKLSLIYILSKENDIIILDEPTIALDYDGVNSLIACINELKTNKLIIISTHDFFFSKRLNPDKILKLEGGKLNEEKEFNDYIVTIIARNDEIITFFDKNKIEFNKIDNKYIASINDSKMDELYNMRKELEILNISFNI